MTSELGEILRKVRSVSADAEGYVNILAELNLVELHEEARTKLEAIGLRIDRVIKNKVIGSIPADKIDALKALPEVDEVELSTRLESHNP